MMETIVGPIRVPGWDDLEAQNNTIGVTLKALVNLEVRYSKGEVGAPTQIAILNETIRLGSGLSPKSQRIINSNIHKLAQMGHVIIPDYKTPKRGRGGPTAPWRSKYFDAVMYQIYSKKED